jgi:hypothetical protein
MEKVVKKRGRKPKGGKIIDMFEPAPSKSQVVTNVILHLKCTQADLEHTNFKQVEQVEPYDLETNHMPVDVSDNTTVHDQLRRLSGMLHKNEISQRSNCFWCTCPFDTPSVHIPKSLLNGKYVVYGVFCCAQCAAGSLLSDTSLDTSTKFERYSMLNTMYSPLHAITPAPQPFYLLNKYLGTLSIEDYRVMIKGKQLTLLVDKPITCSFPELIQSPPDPYISSGVVDHRVRRRS